MIVNGNLYSNKSSKIPYNHVLTFAADEEKQPRDGIVVTFRKKQTYLTNKIRPLLILQVRSDHYNQMLFIVYKLSRIN